MPIITLIYNIVVECDSCAYLIIFTARFGLEFIGVIVIVAEMVVNVCGYRIR